MSMRAKEYIRISVVVLGVALALLALACSSDPTPDHSNFIIAPPPTATPDLSGTADQPTDEAASAEGTPTVTGSSTTIPSGSYPETPLNAYDLGHLPDDPTELMFAAFGDSLADVGRKMAYSHNEAFIPVLMEFIRFQRNEESQLTIASFMVRIRDKIPEDEFAIVPYGQSDWGYWVEWLAQNPEVIAPKGYDGWKGQLFSIIDQSMGEFMYNGVPTTIRIEEIVWGGVRRDGIPDLRFPPAIPPEEATYLDPNDRVFGVSINGEHRAYPLRVLNPHEMANDIVGGVQFALAY